VIERNPSTILYPHQILTLLRDFSCSPKPCLQLLFLQLWCWPYVTSKLLYCILYSYFIQSPHKEARDKPTITEPTLLTAEKLIETTLADAPFVTQITTTFAFTQSPPSAR
jgi:hypothetical protein